MDSLYSHVAAQGLQLIVGTTAHGYPITDDLPIWESNECLAIDYGQYASGDVLSGA